MNTRQPRRRDVAAACVLLFISAVYVAKVASHWETRVELGRVKTGHVSNDTRARLATLRDDVFITYYVTDRARMPSSMRRVEAGVTAVLSALRAAAGGRLDYQRVDPSADPDAQQYAARHGVAPFRARSVERDAYSERTVWSSIGIRYGNRSESVIRGVGPDHLPRLQRLIFEHLAHLEHPRRPVVALSRRQGFSELAGELSTHADVVNVDITDGHALAETVDVLFWLEPNGRPTELRIVDQFLARGGSVVVAGSTHRVALHVNNGEPEASFIPAQSGMDATLRHFGLRPETGLVLDGLSAELPDLSGVAAPFFIRSTPSNHDFRSLRGQPNGPLLFLVPTAIALDGPTLDGLGWTPDVLVTTSDRTSIAPVPARATEIRQLSINDGIPAPKLPLAVLLRPTDPWKGLVVAFGATTPFADAFFNTAGAAHTVLLRTLMDNLASPERLALHRTGVERPTKLPEIAARERFLWRALSILSLPVLLMAVGTARLTARGVQGRRAASSYKWRRLLGGAIGATVVVAGVSLVPGQTLRVDVSREQINELAPQTRMIASRMRGPLAIHAEVIFSSPDRLPSTMRPGLRRLRTMLGELARAGAEISTTAVRPEDLSAPELERLRMGGIDRVTFSDNDDGMTTVRRVFASLRLASGERTEVLHFTTPASFEQLEFRLAFALRRLEIGLRPRILFASDTPRLTPAEAHEQYQTQSLIAPMGTDAYSLARQFLTEYGFDVIHMDVRKPAPTAPDDVLVWLQPRRPVEDLLNLTIRHLNRGGRVLLAAQHFNMQARQYPGTGFRLVYWPQPQWPEIDQLYFPGIGIHLVREVLFDELSTSMAAETQVNRGPRPEIDEQVSTLPFVIRASASNFQDGGTLTAGLGDQAFVSGSSIRWDATRLGQLGIRATPLITTSDHAWTYAWKGGWIPDNILAGPPRKSDQPAWQGRQVLMALFQGSFPLEIVRREGDDVELSGEDAILGGTSIAGREPQAAPLREGTLLLVGGSELFKNHRLRTPEFRADHLLLNAVATLALDDELAAVASRRSVARGFDRLEPSVRLLWRAGIVGVPVLLVLGLAVVRRVGVRRSAQVHGEK